MKINAATRLAAAGVMDNKKIIDRAQGLADKAKDGTERIGGKLYTFKFNPNEWVYRVYDEDNDLVVSFNTKKLPEAKRMLRQWLTS
jgi:hypothetical protein